VENQIVVHMADISVGLKGLGGLVWNLPYDRITIRGRKIQVVHIVSDPEGLDEEVKKPCVFRIDLT
jgi:hypothetical protein